MQQVDYTPTTFGFSQYLTVLTSVCLTKMVNPTKSDTDTATFHIVFVKIVPIPQPTHFNKHRNGLFSSRVEQSVVGFRLVSGFLLFLFA